MRGALATARAMATRCCSPPESSAGRCSSALLEPEIAEQLGRALRRLALAQPADHLRQHDVLERGELRQQVVRLVDEADVVAADAGALGVGQSRGRRVVDVDLAGIRVLEQAGDVQQRRLAGAGRRDQRHRLPGHTASSAPVRISSVASPCR